MKIIHCADLHLDAKLHTHLDRIRAKRRRDELLRNFGRLADYAAENGVEAVLIAGDLFDRDTVSALARNTVLSVIRAHPRIRFYYLRGNHDTGDCLRDVKQDSPSRTPPPQEGGEKEGTPVFLQTSDGTSYAAATGGNHATGAGNAATAGGNHVTGSGNSAAPSRSSLTGAGNAVSGGGPENLFLFGSRWKTYLEGENGGIAISGIELGRENAASAFRSLRLEQDRFNIVLLHGQTNKNAPQSSGHQIFTAENRRGEEKGAGLRADLPARPQPGYARTIDATARPQSGYARTIDLPALRGRGIDYLALGHIHSWQVFRLDAGGLGCYPGCLEGRGFDECGPHGFALLEIDEKHHRMLRHTFMPFARRLLYELEVDVSGCMTTAQMNGLLENALRTAGCRPKDMADVTLTGELDVECEKDIGFLRTGLSSRLFFARLRDATTLRIDPEDYLYDASLRGEFVRTVLADTSIPEEEKAAVIRYGFQAMDGEEI